VVAGSLGQVGERCCALLPGVQAVCDGTDAEAGFLGGVCDCDELFVQKHCSNKTLSHSHNARLTEGADQSWYSTDLLVSNQL
jgi:hypothetical protein